MYYDNNSDSIHYKGLGDRRALFEPKEDYHKPIRTGNAFSRNGDKDKTLSIKDYLDKI